LFHSQIENLAIPDFHGLLAFCIHNQRKVSSVVVKGTVQYQNLIRGNETETLKVIDIGGQISLIPPLP
jgi:hypothetical protein